MQSGKYLLQGIGAGIAGGLTLHFIGSEITLFNIMLCAFVGMAICHSIYTVLTSGKEE